MTARPLLRHCPLCGIAMQASRPQRGEIRFDCLTCHTAIVERPINPPNRQEQPKKA